MNVQKKMLGMLLLVVLFMVSGVKGQEYVTDGLVAFYTFDEDDTDGATVLDVFGENHATIVGTLAFTDGVIDDALDFDRMGNYVEIPPLGDFPHATVECWAQTRDLLSHQYQGLVSTWAWAAGKVHFKFENGAIQAHKQDGVKVATSAEANRWYHIVYTTDTTANEFKLYVDGALVGQAAAGTVPENMNERRIGSEHDDNRYLDGMMDEVRIYDRVLSAEEVLQNYEVTYNESYPACPRRLRAAPDGRDMVLTWENGTAVPESVRVVRNGEELAAAAPASEATFRDVAPSPGVLTYELTFAVAGETCITLTKTYEACIRNLTATSTSTCEVTLSWTNGGLSYDQIEVKRNQVVIATLAGDQESYDDTDPVPGLSVYTVAPTNGACDPVTVEAGPQSSYAALVLADDAYAYWPFNEPDGATTAVNHGPAGASINGTYTGTVALEDDGLLMGSDDTAVNFDGSLNTEIRIPDSAQINIGGPHLVRSIEMWFRADFIGFDAQMLYQHGGTTRGISIYVINETGDEPMLYICAWNRAEEQWGTSPAPVFISTEIEEEEVYHLVFVFEATTNEIYGDFDGRMTGYLNGEEFDEASGVDRLYAASGDTSFGGVQGAVVIHTNATVADANFFGVLDEAAMYHYALDDPNGDDDRSDSRVAAHFAAAGGGGCPISASAEADGESVRLSWCPEDAETVRIVRGETELADAAPAAAREFVDDAPPLGILEYTLTFSSAEGACTPVTVTYNGCITGLAAEETPEGAVRLTWSNGFSYPGGIMITRDIDGEGAEVLEPAYSGAAEEYIDESPPFSGVVTYTAAPVDGSCEAAETVITLVCDPVPEVCDNNRDDDCDGLVDCEDPDCDGASNCMMGERFRRGDINMDGKVDLADPVALLSYLFADAAIPACPDAADGNDDGSLNLADAISILSHLFADAGPLPAPFDQCGEDPVDGEPDELDCPSFPPCDNPG